MDNKGRPYVILKCSKKLNDWKDCPRQIKELLDYMPLDESLPSLKIAFKKKSGIYESDTSIVVVSK